MSTRQTKKNYLPLYEMYVQNIKPSTNGWYTGICPFHDDRNPSLAFHGESGNWTCHAGCGKGTVKRFFRKLKMRSLFNGQNEAINQNAINMITTYDYKDENEDLLFQTVRRFPKSFSMRRPGGVDGWTYNLHGVKLIPFNLPEVIKASTVYICEGEKDCLSLKKWRLVATTNPMGAEKWSPEFNKYFKDKKIIILPDNDKPGKKHAEQVAKYLYGIAKSVRIVELPGLKDKEDITDWINKGHRRWELRRLVKHTQEWIPSAIDLTHYTKTGAELRRLECRVEWLADKILPKQSITLLHGRGGIGKSYLALQLAKSVSERIDFMGHSCLQSPVYYIDFENPLPVLKERSDIVGADTVNFMHIAFDARPPKLDSHDWELYKSLPAGSLLIFDTLRAAQGQDENDSRHMAEIMEKLKVLRENGFTILLLHHTPKSNDRTYKGSTAISDLCDHVLSLHKVSKTDRSTEIDYDDNENDAGFRWFGTKDKTRYEHYHTFLQFNADGGFELAPDPDEQHLKDLHKLINELKSTEGEPPNQTRIIEKATAALTLGDKKVRALLKKGEGTFWRVEKKSEMKNAKIFYPIDLKSHKAEKLRKVIRFAHGARRRSLRISGRLNTNPLASIKAFCSNLRSS